MRFVRQRIKRNGDGLWLRQIRATTKLKGWWPTLQANLRGHFQYYGISGNSRAIERHHYVTKRLVLLVAERRCGRDRQLLRQAAPNLLVSGIAG